LEIIHQIFQGRKSEQDVGFEIDEQKKRSGPTPSNIVSFFGSVGPYSEMIFIKKQIELYDFILFITKELVPLFIIKSPFVR
jgi:hypothetical protein